MKIDVRFSNPFLRTSSPLFSRIVRVIAEAAILSSRAYIRGLKAHGKALAPLYKSGVFYQNEEPGKPDHCVDIRELYERGHGDCLHLSVARVAELRESGEDSRAKIRLTFKPLKNKKGRLFHVTVRRGNGTVEDPSKILGMK